MQSVPYRPLGIIKTMLDNLGFEVSHCYEDLVFINHNAFMLRMEEHGEEVSLLFNTESTPEAREEISKSLQSTGRTVHLNITRAGTYKLVPNQANATIDIHLIDNL